MLNDRVVKTAEARFDREQVCRFLGREIIFGKRHSDKFLIGSAVSKISVTGSLPDIIESLVSSGVLQWAEGRSSVRFFHQTFLEFAAAYDLLLCTDPELATAQIESLLDDVANFNFFRAPVLKQLAIQSFDVNPGLHSKLMHGLRDINNELAAQLILEIVGKIPDARPAIKLASQWITEDADIVQGVICETVRHYPKAKTAIALDFLQPFLSSAKETVIYSLCIDTFAKSEPQLVYDFLHSRLPAVLRSDDVTKSYYKNALLAVATHGEFRALDDLITLLPKAKQGLQAGILQGIAEITTEKNAPQVDQLIAKVSDLLARMHKKSRNDVSDALGGLISAMHHVAPEIAIARGRWFLDTEVWRRDVGSAMLVGRIAAITGAYSMPAEEALNQLRSPDHLVRMLHTGFLAHFKREHAPQLIRSILNLDQREFAAVDTVRSLSLLSVVSRALKLHRYCNSLSKQLGQRAASVQRWLQSSKASQQVILFQQRAGSWIV